MIISNILIILDSAVSSDQQTNTDAIALKLESNSNENVQSDSVSSSGFGSLLKSTSNQCFQHQIVTNSNKPDEGTNNNNNSTYATNSDLLEDFDKYFIPCLKEGEDQPKAPPRTKKKYCKSKTVDVTRFGVVVTHENDSLENSCTDEGDSPKLDFKNVDSVINESLGLHVSPPPSSPPLTKDLNDSLEECLNTQANQKDIDFLYEIGTKIERCPSGGNENGDDDVVVINECVTFVTTLPKETGVNSNFEEKNDLKSNSSSNSSIKDAKFERTMSKRPLWDKTPRQEVDLMFHRSPHAKQTK